MRLPAALLFWSLLPGCAAASPPAPAPDALPVVHAASARGHTFAVVHSDEEWKQLLDPEEYRILRQGGTEPAFTGKYWDNHAHGVYRCAACGQLLFVSEAKFDSGTGWPSFYQPATEESVVTKSDLSYGMIRTEVLCGRCGGHLGHVFDDGPAPTGQRYCIDGNATDFEATEPGPASR